MHFYFYVCLCLAGKSAGLVEVIVRLLLTRGLLLRYHWRIKCIFCCNCFSSIQVIPVSLLLCLLVITYIECLPASNSGAPVMLGYTVYKAPTLIVRVLYWHLLTRPRPSTLVLTLYPSVRIKSLCPSWVTVICCPSSMIVKVVRCDSHLDITICFCIDCSFISIAI